MRPSFLLPLLPAVMLAACTATGGSSTSSAPSSSQFENSSGGVCNVDALNPAGQQAGDSQVQRLVRQSGAARARVLVPDRMYTTDYDASRLSIRVDEQNRIISVYCG